MATGSAGSITLRLGVAGSAEVKAALASLGPAGAAALREIEAAQSKPTVGMRALSAGAQEVTTGLEGLSNRAGAAGSVLSDLGPAGLAAAAGIGAVITATVGLTKAGLSAMQFGEAIETSAKKAGVSTTALQVWRYAAQQSGVDAATSDEALTKFAEAFGGAGEGAKRYLTIFKQLGFTPEQLKSFGSVDEALDAVTSKIAGLGSAADRDYFAKKLGMEGLIPVLADGSAHLAAVRKEALEFGHVMDEQTVRALADSEKKFKDASDAINIQFKSAIVGVAPMLVELVKEIADAARALNDFMDQFKGIQTRSTQAITDQRDALLKRNAQLIHEHGYDAVHADNGGASLEYQQNLLKYVDLQSELNNRAAADKPAARSSAGSFTPAGGRRRGAGPTTDEVDQQNRALADQAQADVLAATKRELTARLALTDDVEARDGLEKQINALDDQAEAAAQDRREAEAKDKLDRLTASKTATEAEKRSAQAAYEAYLAQEAIAKAENATAQAARDQKDDRDKTIKLAEQQGAVDDEIAGAKIAQLREQLALSKDMAERRALALQIFDLETAEKLAQLKLTQMKQQLAGDSAGAALTGRQIGDLNALSPLQRQGVSQANPANAWDQWVQKQKQDLPTLQQEWSNLKVGGIDAFNSSLFDSEGRINNLQQVFHNVMLAMIKDLEQYLLKQAEIGLVGGGSGGGSGGLLGNIFSLFGGGAGAAGASVGTSVGSSVGAMFAGGGKIHGPGTSTSDSILIHVSDGERVMNAAAERAYGPVLEAMNKGASTRPGHFASGGRVGGGTASPAGAAFGESHYHDNRDFSIHGADTTQIESLAQQQRTYAKQEPARWVAYAQGARLLPK